MHQSLQLVGRLKWLHWTMGRGSNTIPCTRGSNLQISIYFFTNKSICASTSLLSLGDIQNYAGHFKITIYFILKISPCMQFHKKFHVLYRCPHLLSFINPLVPLPFQLPQLTSLFRSSPQFSSPLWIPDLDKLVGLCDCLTNLTIKRGSPVWFY